MLKLTTLLTTVFILSATARGQGDDFYVNYSNGGLCSTSIRLKSDGTYVYGSGCENSSYLSFGTWTQTKDTVKLVQFDTKDFKIVKILPSTTERSNRLAVKVFNQHGENITNKLRLVQYVQGKGEYPMLLDSSNQAKTDFLRDSGIIIIKALERLPKTDFGIVVGNYNNYEITINIPNDSVYKIGSNWINTGDFELLKTKEALLSTTIYPADGGAKPFRIVYKKQMD